MQDMLCLVFMHTVHKPGLAERVISRCKVQKLLGHAQANGTYTLYSAEVAA